MGKSQGTQKTTTETKLPAWYNTAAQDAIAFANTAADNLAKPYTGNTVAPLDPLQQQAINLTGQNIGATNAAYGQAQGGASAAMGYRPQMVGNNYSAMMLGGNYNPLNVSAGQQGYGYAPERVAAGQQDYAFNPTPTTVGNQSYDYSPERVSAGAQDYSFNPNAVNAGQQGYGYNPLDVQGGSFLTGNIGAYMNPFVSGVEQAALGNMQQGFQQGLNTISDRAINAGAFGGSRQGVAEGTAASEFARQYGDLSATLRNQAYTAGTDLMGQDLSRNMQAQLANQQAGMSNAQFGANLGLQNIANDMQAQQFNVGKAMDNAQFGANLGFQNQQQALQAALANQQAGMESAQFGTNIGLQNIANNMATQQFNAGQAVQNAQFGANLGLQNQQQALQAALANQQAGMSNAQFGANLGLQNIDNALQASLANQNAGLQGAQLNQQAMLANQDALYNQFALQQQAALANQQAGLQGAQLNLQGSGMLGDLATAGQTAYLQSLQSALSAGQINQDQAQALLAQEAARYDANRNYPLEQLNLRLAALGGTQVPTSSTVTRPTSGNWLTGAAGGALAGMQFGPLGAAAGGLLGGLSAR